MVKPNTIRVALSHDVSSKWPINQIDVNNVFLNGDLTEEVYMQQSSGFELNNPNLVCKLNKDIYGLKQAPISCLKKHGITHENLGFQSTKSNISLFVLLLQYIDDIIITGSSTEAVMSLISTLIFRFAF